MEWEVAIATGGRINNYRGSSDNGMGPTMEGVTRPTNGMGPYVESHHAAERQLQTGGHQTHFGLGVIRTTPKDNLTGGHHTHVGLRVI